MSLIGKMYAGMAAKNADSWRLLLERLRGKIGDDGIERITTQTVFDILEIPQRNRSASACRRLAKLMTELGWTAVRVRALTRGGYLEQVRGYARDARNEQRSSTAAENAPCWPDVSATSKGQQVDPSGVGRQPAVPLDRK